MGLCWNISNSVKVLGYTDSHGETAYGFNMKRNFPEVYKFRPIKRKWHNDHHWFACDDEGMQKRIAVLEQAIIITESL